jgi:hypothetical protein
MSIPPKLIVRVNLRSRVKSEKESLGVQIAKPQMMRSSEEGMKPSSPNVQEIESCPKVEEESVLQVETVDGRFSILRPVRSRPENCRITLTDSPEEILRWVQGVSLVDSEDVVAFDTETTGTQVFGNKDFRMVSFGLCHREEAISLDVRSWTREQIANFLKDFRDLTYKLNTPLVAHNLFYDGSVMAFYLGSTRGDKSGAPGWLNYKFCTYALFRYLSSEGFIGQAHSLKFAMTELLGWKNTNEKEQHDWLINHGWVKGTRGIHDSESPEEQAVKMEMLKAKILEGKQYRPDKGMMYKVPHDILGRYNALDCYATYELYRKVLLPAMRKYTVPFFTFWQSEVMLMTIRSTMDNYQCGISVDADILNAYYDDMQDNLRNRLYYKFSQGKYKVAYFKLINEKYKLFCEEKKPKTLCKAKGAEPTPPKKLLDKSGYPTKAALRYKVKLKMWKAKEQSPSKAYMTFMGRRKLLWRMLQKGIIASHVDDKHWARKYLFNPASVADKTTFLYDDVEYEIIPSRFKDRPGRLVLKNGVEVDMSQAGGLPTGKSAITAIGGKKHILNVFNREIKKAQFVATTKNRVEQSDDGLLHMGYKTPGTVTQRLSGDGGLNLQNIIKDSSFLRAWRCHNMKDHLILQADLCYHPDTEVLTKKGWKPIAAVTTSDEVWQVNSISLEGAWCHPLHTIEHDYDGMLHIIGNIRGSLRVTGNHRMLYVGGHASNRADKTARRSVIPAKDGVPFIGACLPITSTPLNPTVSDWKSEDIWKAAALQADGCVDIRAKKRRNFYLQVSRTEKRAKANQLFGPGHLQKLRPEHTLQKELWSSIKFDHPLLETDGTRRKLFRADLIGDNQLLEFLEALAFWDGSVEDSGTIVYASVSKEQVDCIQHRLVRAGYECKCDLRIAKDSKYLGCYYLRIHKNDRFHISKKDYAQQPYQGKVYCLTVPAGFFMVRHGNQTFVSGNCAVEPHVFTELSRDEAMWDLYGPEAKQNDVYLYTGAKIGGILGQPFLDEGYDPKNPTKAAIKLCKEKHKNLRNVSKTLLLSDDYGSSARKKWQTLKIQGFNFTLKEVEDMHNKLAEVYKGKKDFGDALRREWERNGGWVLDAFGMPICVDSKKIKDLSNRICQRSGHFILMLWQYILMHKMWEEGIEYFFQIANFHDEMLIEVRRDQLPLMKQLYADCLKEVNDKWLKGMIKIKAEPQVATCLAEIKVEEYIEDELKHLLEGIEL